MTAKLCDTCRYQNNCEREPDSRYKRCGYEKEVRRYRPGTLCERCVKRDRCTTLCAKAEKIVDRDHVSQHEKTFPKWTLEKLPGAFEMANGFYDIASYFAEDKLNHPDLTEIQNKCLKHFVFDGLSYKEIAMRVNRRVRQVEYQIYSAKRRLSVLNSTVEG